MLFRCFGSHFRKKAAQCGFSTFVALLMAFGGQNLILYPKSVKPQKRAKDEKASFSLQAQNSDKHKVLGTFLEPKTPKIAFSAFGPTFRFWCVLGAKSAPEAENELNSIFCFQKWKNRVFVILVEKGCPKRCVYKGFCASGESE